MPSAFAWLPSYGDARLDVAGATREIDSALADVEEAEIASNSGRPQATHSLDQRSQIRIAWNILRRPHESKLGRGLGIAHPGII